MHLHHNHTMAFCWNKPKDAKVKHGEPFNDDGFHTQVQSRQQHIFQDYGRHSGGIRPIGISSVDDNGDRCEKNSDPVAQLKAANEHLIEQETSTRNENVALKMQLRQFEEELDTLRYQQTFDGSGNQPASEHNSRLESSHGHNMVQSRRDSDISCSRFEYQRMQSHLANYEENNMKLQQQLLQCREEKEELQNRLSEYVSTKITDNNPNIVNLGDKNRPEKLTERFSEMYDNQWTEAFDFLHESTRKIEMDTIQYILKLLMTIFAACEETARDHLVKTEKSILKMIGTTEMPDHMKMHMKACKEERKRNFAGALPSVDKAVKKKLKLNDCIIYVHEEGAIKKFVTEATEICWLMCIQDPPMVLDTTNCLPGNKVDKRRFRHYTNTGKSVEYLVWPAVCQYRDGPVLQKGIVQGTHRKKNLFGKSVGGNKKKHEVDVHPHSSHGTEQEEINRNSTETSRIYRKDGTPAQFAIGTELANEAAAGTKSRRDEKETMRQGQAGSRMVRKTDIKSHSFSDTWSDKLAFSRNFESDGRPLSNMESTRQHVSPYNEQGEITVNSVLSVTSIENDESSKNTTSARDPHASRFDPTYF